MVGDVPEVRPVGLQPRPRRDESVEIVELRRQLPPHARIADGGDARGVDERSLDSSRILRAQSRRRGGLRHGDRRRCDVVRECDRDRRPAGLDPAVTVEAAATPQAARTAAENAIMVLRRMASTLVRPSDGAGRPRTSAARCGTAATRCRCRFGDPAEPVGDNRGRCSRTRLRGLVRLVPAVVARRQQEHVGLLQVVGEARWRKVSATTSVTAPTAMSLSDAGLPLPRSRSSTSTRIGNSGMATAATGRMCALSAPIHDRPVERDEQDADREQEARPCILPPLPDEDRPTTRKAVVAAASSCPSLTAHGPAENKTAPGTARSVGIADYSGDEDRQCLSATRQSRTVESSPSPIPRRSSDWSSAPATSPVYASARPKSSTSICTSPTPSNPSRWRIGRDIEPPWVISAGLPRVTASSQRARMSAR